MLSAMLFHLILLASCAVLVDGHGYLFEPVARSSAWLVDPAFKECCSYSGHMEMFCGGVGHQWNVNGGKCGLCGEPYDRAVKLFEKGGRMYLGKVVQTYAQGQIIEVKVKLSANHQGYFEFRLCNVDDARLTDATDECLERHLLTIVDSNSTKYRDISRHGSDMITVRVQLPSELACQHCVFQWKYTTGNNWGRDPTTNKSGPGLGRENETFMGCSDVSITARKTTTARPPMIVKSKTTTKATRKDSTSATAEFWIALLSKYWSLASTTQRIPPTTTRSSSPTTTTVTTTTSTRSSAPLALWSSLLVAYQRGDEVLYDSHRYRCVTGHRSYAGAEPGPLTWALWRKIS